MPAGAEAQVRGGEAADVGRTGIGPVAQLVQIWRVVLRGLVVKNINELEMGLV